MQKRQAITHQNGLPKFIGYLRVSKEKETTGSHTFETQESRIREYLDRRCGAGKYEIELFQDDGLSGGYGLSPTGIQPRVRPTLQIISEKIQTRAYAGLVVYGLSRLIRQVRGLAELIEDVLLPSGTSLLSATEDIDISTSDGRMMAYLKGIFDQQQRETIIKRNKDAAATRTEAGYWLGQVPYGWMWEVMAGHQLGSQRRGIASVPEEKQWVLYIKDRYLSGWNTNRIAADLNEKQVPSPVTREACGKKAANIRARKGHEPRWTYQVVWRILKSPAHAGMVRTPAGKLIRGQHWEERVWEPEVLDQILQSHDLKNARFKAQTGRRNTPHLLSGLICCARCGKRLYMSSTSQTTKAHRSYKCFTPLEDKSSSCSEVVARAQWVEEAVVKEIGRIASEPEMRRLLEQEVAHIIGQQDENLKEEQKLLRRKVEQFEDQFHRWADAFTRGTMTESQFQKFNQKLLEDQSAAQQRLEEIERELENWQGRQKTCEHQQEQLLEFPLIWETLDNDERRNLLSLLIEKDSLTVDRVGRDIELRMKVHLLPPATRIIPYQSNRGKRHTFASGLQVLTQRQMVLLYHASEGKSHPECAHLMGCKLPSIYTMVNTIRKNLGVSSWEEAVEMARDQVNDYQKKLPLNSCGRANIVNNTSNGACLFLSPVLMQVFELFAQGATAPEVAEKLHLTTSTVQGRRQRILKTFNTSSMFEAVQQAKQKAILT